MSFQLTGSMTKCGLAATSPQMHEVRKLAEVARDWASSITVLGGAAPWVNPSKCVGLFDLIVSGESDHPNTVRDIVARAQFLQPRRLRGLPDAWLAPRITPGPLDWALPPIRRWDYKYNAYLEDHSGTKHKTTTLFTSRGCPMACAFCESGRNGVIWDRFVRYEPLSLVAEQFREIAGRGHTGLMFYDDILPLNKPRTLALAELIRQYGFVWRCFLRTDVISHQGGLEYLRALSDSGLVEV